MSRSTSLLSILTGLGLIAVTAAGVSAGSGAGGGGTSFTGFQCYTINGANQPRVVSLSDQFGTRDSVPVGNGRLICTPVTGEVVSGNELDVLPVDDTQDPPVSLADHYKCYDIPPFARDSRGRIRLIDVNVEIKITDQQDIEVVKAHTPILLCMLAVKELTAPPAQ